MNLEMAYLGTSGVKTVGTSQVLQFEPNLTREPVGFSAPLTQPLRFREAMSALHDVVISDLRYQPRDKTAYRRWQAEQSARMAQVRRTEYERVRKEIEQSQQTTVGRDLKITYQQSLKRYWRARKSYADMLRRDDPELWRKLMPYDPVITVADDVVFFECFSADESSYGCLTVDRDGGFGATGVERLGTTNVDYSWQLYDHFQTLRSYRQTRFEIDPQGFEVQTAGREEYREEKIDIPPHWLRGFMQLQGAMAMPTRKVSLRRETVYSLLAWLKRHKAHTSPRGMRFELVPGKPVRIVFEPWEQAVVDAGRPWDGPSGPPVRIWGRRRLLSLARVLPLIDSVDVHLLGTGLPSFWVARMGEMRLTLGMSGWTTNDWTGGGSALDLLAPPGEPDALSVQTAVDLLKCRRVASFEEMCSGLMKDAGSTAATLNHLAHAGQAIFDLTTGQYRYRQILPQPVGEDMIGPPNEELSVSKRLAQDGRVKLESKQEDPEIGVVLTAKVDGKPVDLLMTSDGRITRGKCLCGFYRRFGLRNGPCRHMLALRSVAMERSVHETDSTAAWYKRLADWRGN